MNASSVTIYHHPTCGTSRNALAMLRASGVEPVVIEYAKAGWEKTQLRQLLARLGLSAGGLLRTKEKLAREMGLLEPGVTEEQILEAMVKHPLLVERPIVVSPRGAALCRPSERVFGLVDHPPREFVKENGERVTP